VTQPTDRDAALEHLLRALPEEDLGSIGDCLDAEAAAALSEGGLPPAERSAYMAHVSGCSRCQALLGALIRTTPVPAPARAWWRRAWLVPALATGLAVTVWIALERAGPRVAVVRIPAAITEPAKEDAELANVTRPKPPLDPLRQSAIEQQNSRVRSRQVGPLPDALADTTQLPSALDRTAGVPKAVPSTADAATASAPSAPPAALASNAERAEQSFAQVRRDKAVEVGRAAALPASPPPPAPVSESVGVTAPTVGGGGLAKTSAPAAAIDVISPDARIRWRIVGNAVEHSADGGATWSPQALGVSSRLTGGSAPLPEVCWIVGDGGTVVVTADGVSWNRLAFPEPAPLASVTASSADAATVTTSDGRVFTTIDRGKTWTPR